ncbi:conserved hypothetical protein [Ricinus communis]|uniref:Uncharacterized protein n=1 Tax=Ricinus communis TaxID=3988 RepID=B9S3Q7_RICCO|nr:conserved hypothetical protein [Ricinus communis]
MLPLLRTQEAVVDQARITAIFKGIKTRTKDRFILKTIISHQDTVAIEVVEALEEEEVEETTPSQLVKSVASFYC